MARMTTSFLGKYDAPLTLWLEADGGQTWWVKYRACLTGRERDSVRDRLGHQVPTTTGVEIIWNDPFEHQRERTLMLIHSWNLTSDDGVLAYDFDWETELLPDAPPSGRRVSWEALPEDVQDEIIAGIRKGASEDEPTRAEDAAFPEGGGLSPVGGEDEPSDDRQGVA